MIKLFDSTFGSLEKAMDLRIKRHALLSGNIANAETPNYKARELDFAGELTRALNANANELKTTNPRHMDVRGGREAHIVHDYSSPVGADGNNVDLDIATGKISTNARGYTGAATLMSMKMRILRFASRGGRGV